MESGSYCDFRGNRARETTAALPIEPNKEVLTMKRTLLTSEAILAFLLMSCSQGSGLSSTLSSLGETPFPRVKPRS